VVRYWNVKPYEGSRVLLSYADKSPALIERVFKGSKNGHVLLWTTPLSRRGISTVPDAWNEFPVKNWSFLGLMDQTAAYLSGTTEESLTFEAGNEVVLPIDPTRRHTNYIVQDPEKKTSDRLSPPATSDALVIAAQSVGNWNRQGFGRRWNGRAAWVQPQPARVGNPVHTAGNRRPRQAFRREEGLCPRGPSG